MMLTLKALARKIGGTFHGKDTPKPNVSIDTRTLKKGDLYVAIKGPRFDGHQFIKQAIDKGASCVMVDHPVGSKVPELVVSDTLEALGMMSKVWREQFQIPVFGITGSCGKTGTKEMLTAILSEVGKVHSTKGNYNNAFGLPLTLLGLNDSHEYAVLEMGTSSPGEIRHLVEIAKPTIALITNIGASHVEGFGTLKAISKEKSEIFAGLDEDGIAIVNLDDDFAKEWKGRIEKRHRVSFGTTPSADVFIDHISYTPRGFKCELHTPIGVQDCFVPLLGEHVGMNAAAAAAAALAVGTNIEAVVTGLSKVKPVKGRLLPTKLDNGCYLIDDTYNASAKSVENALKLLRDVNGKRIFVMSNMAELGPDSEKYHREMGEMIQSFNINKAFLTGNKDLLKPTLQAAGIAATYFPNQQALVEVLKPELDSETVVLVKGCRSCHMENIVEAIKEESCSIG